MKDCKALEKKRVLVVGGTGFIGSYLTSALVDSGPASVSVISRSGSVAFNGVEVHRVDAGDLMALREFAQSRDFDIIYNLSGKIDQSTAIGIYASQLASNTQTTINLAEAFSGRVGRFIQVGSNAEYGDAPCPQAPDGPALPCSAYGVTKLAASQVILAKAKSEGFPGLVARPFLVYGPGQSKNSFLEKAVEAAARMEAFDTTPGEQTRDFTPVQKVADELLQLSCPNNPTACIYNLCTGVPIRLRDALTMLKELRAGFTPNFGTVPYRKTELMASCGVAWMPWTELQAKGSLQNFLATKLDEYKK